jgi:hypothetical protein
VILARVFRDNVPAVSPSGKQAMSYYDVTVLPIWKGSDKVGDLLTFALPGGGVRCGMVPPEYGPDDSAAAPSNFDWGDAAGGPYVLLLHESRGDETQVTPGLRRAGGDGTQGLFALPATYDYRDKYDRRAPYRLLSRVFWRRGELYCRFGPKPGNGEDPIPPRSAQNEVRRDAGS